ncbi:hypothetical protein TNIN_282461 [Trichonephila inaurata madagascariensis]|uniref:Uncharacterized protein n=1 Tax=Trichonephila inaurata madagascariensis TaxID=2747483 RepID=A0A8X7C693_9ARAC|nr:hypothetical protein TNIN_282461 [Trichonephila inaurata madagascariensis]
MKFVLLRVGEHLAQDRWNVAPLLFRHKADGLAHPQEPFLMSGSSCSLTCRFRKEYSLEDLSETQVRKLHVTNLVKLSVANYVTLKGYFFL